MCFIGSKACVVHSTELTLLKCPEFHLSCILTVWLWVAPTLSFVDFDTAHCSRYIWAILCENRTNCCMTLTHYQFQCRIFAFHSHELVWRYETFGEIHFRSNGRYTTISRCSTHAHIKQPPPLALCLFFNSLSLFFVPFFRVCAPWTHHRIGF